jgi:protein TonB
MSDRVQGEVWVRAIVSDNGCVASAEVTRSLHPDLDFEALHAVLQWRFEPARRNGLPLAVVVSVAVAFNLK